MADKFDLNAFLMGIADASAIDPELRANELEEAVRERMGELSSEMVPALWACIDYFAMRAPRDTVHLNAVVNSVTCGLCLWLAALTPDNEPSRDQVRTKVLQNLEHAFQQSDTVKAELAVTASTQGRDTIIDMVNSEILAALKSASYVLNEAATEIRKARGA